MYQVIVISVFFKVMEMLIENETVKKLRYGSTKSIQLHGKQILSKKSDFF